MSLKAGDVVRLWMPSTNPPKVKFCVILAVDAPVLMFLINTAKTGYALANPDIDAMQVQIEAEANPFLSYDSWIDCTAPFSYSIEQLSKEITADPHIYVGSISREAAAKIVKTVSGSRLVPPRKASRIATSLIESYGLG